MALSVVQQALIFVWYRWAVAQQGVAVVGAVDSEEECILNEYP